MGQRKLRLEELKVDSFEVLPETPKERGTVQGNIAYPFTQANTCFQDTCNAVHTCAKLNTCAYTCGDTCAFTCRVTCAFTCADSCENTCGATCIETRCAQVCPVSGDPFFCPIV